MTQGISSNQGFVGGFLIGDESKIGYDSIHDWMSFLLFINLKIDQSEDREGKLAPGAIANLVDAVGAGCVNVGGHPVNVSVDMSISFLSSVKIDDELEIIGQVLGKKGGYSGTSIIVKNKATGELIAEGRHSLFGKYASKM